MTDCIPDWMALHGEELERHLGRMVNDADEVSDLMQHVWVQAWRLIPERGDGVNVRAWLYRVATNAAIDRIAHRRRWRARLGSLAADPAARASDPPRTPLSERTRKRVREALADLPRKQREAVWFRWVEGLDYAEVARKLDSSPESARANVRHGLKRLRHLLAEFDEEA